MHIIPHTAPQRDISHHEITERVESLYGPLYLPKGYFDYVDREVFVSLSQEQERAIATLMGRIDAIMLQVYDYAYRDRYEHLAPYHPWLESFRSLYPCDEHFIARYDLIFDREGVIKCIENNANTPGMQLESIFFTEWLTPQGYTSHAAKIRDSIRAFWQRIRAERGIERLAILTAYTFEEEDHLVCRTYAELLSEVFGSEGIVVGDIYDMHLSDGGVSVR